MMTNDENANDVGNQSNVRSRKRKYISNNTPLQKDNKVLKNGTGDVSQVDLDKQKGMLTIYKLHAI